MMTAEPPTGVAQRLFPVYVEKTDYGPYFTWYSAVPATLPLAPRGAQTEQEALECIANAIAKGIQWRESRGLEVPFQPAEKPPEGAVLRWVAMPTPD